MCSIKVTAAYVGGPFHLTRGAIVNSRKAVITLNVEFGLDVSLLFIKNDVAVKETVGEGKRENA